ncbi:MAG: rhodanese-like domain-containing protein [Cytophagales bacterium]|nr:rhodanese-like domain-containing protein [Cytophagales bacterium]
MFVCDAGREAEVVTRLARVGYDHVLGYLGGGMAAWKAAGNVIDTIEEITPAAFVTLFRDASDSILLDVRRASEFEREHIIGAYNIPLSELYKNLNNLSTRRTYYLYCAGGYRSLIAASIFKSGGIKQVINIKGGYNALKETGLPKTNYSEVNTEL